ncbi:glycosyltransferase family 4 protein [Cohnella thailandensis]|uniref:Glycosyltransferase family 4 protein n=1 Tax=Cohnella thailandensis TaxID=557557 RepID=A0A841T7V0_9BACL|nr:glycosyltransferase family 4 protein [Cohnella thailandensis]MBB6638140.1 glycosyltransferase family 4 protein [Cohnella thailandensis]MBP1971933.1 glycosyltransferase involved in cell wall biosynthesis [Cohnella thailandensis]
MKVIQVMDALDYGDAVSSHAIEIHGILDELGFSNEIRTIHVHEKVKHLRKSIDELLVQKDDIILFHFSGKSSSFDKIRKLKCKKLLIYHNITPHEFFEGMEPHYTHCMEGRKQLLQLAGQFDMYIGDSEFNVQELQAMGCEPTYVMPIVLELGSIIRRTVKDANKGRKFLFVGRVAPNKKHEDIMRVFDYYCKYIDPQATLHLVGNYQDYLPYYERLQSYRAGLLSRDRILFTGKVSAEERDHYYRNADVLLSMSEHEGFCVPLLESMSYGIPTFVFNCGAVKTTMGNAGVLIHEKRFEDIAELIDAVLSDKKLAQEIIDKQYEWLNHFSRDESVKQLVSILEEARSL